MRSRQRWMGPLFRVAFVGVVAAATAWPTHPVWAAPRAVLVEEFTSRW